MTRSTTCVLALWLLLPQGCGEEGGDEPEDPCETSADLCDREGQTRCVTSTAVQRCEPAPEGDCLLWAADRTCGGRSSCEEVGVGEAECVCAHECPDEGPRACDGDTILECAPDEDGCLHYTLGRDCGEEDLVCDDSSGTPDCVVFCQDRCDVEGATECSGDYLMTCIRSSFGCLAIQATDCTEEERVCDDSSDPARCAAP